MTTVNGNLILGSLMCGLLCGADIPRLVIDPGGHSAAVRGVVFTSDSRFLVSAGEDKTVRVWDVSAGKTVRTIRGQIGDGQQGKIYAVALSPDDRLLAVGGWLSKEINSDRGSTIRIFDLRKGEIVSVLEGLENVTECLAFSPDGRYLASGSADRSARIWDTRQFKLIKELTGHTDRVHSVAFSPDSSLLATGSLDHSARVWSVPTGAPVSQMNGHTASLVSVAFSADGSRLLSIGEDSALRFWNARNGVSLGTIPTVGPRPANLSLTRDGAKVLTTGLVAGRPLAAVLATGSNQVLAQFTQNDGLITATAVSPDSKLAATAGGARNEIFIWDLNSGVTVRKLTGTGSPIRAVGFAKDQRSIAIGLRPVQDSGPNRYGSLESVIWLGRDKDNLRLELGGAVSNPSDYITAIDHIRDYSLTVPEGRPTVLQLLKAGKIANEFTRDATSGYRHICYTLTPEGNVISGGLGGVLSLYTPDGRKSEFVGHTGLILSVAVSPDGKTLVSGSDDETIRLWDISTRRLLLSIFVDSASDWMAWTPEGYYASSLTGDRYCGWHVNQGYKREALYYSAARFQKEFYRPDVIGRLLETRSTQTAMQAANVARGKPEQPVLSAVDVAAILPPLVYIIDPDKDGQSVQQETFHLRAVALSNTLPITDLTVLLNGAVASKLPVNGVRKEVDMDLHLRKGANTIKILAANGKATAESDLRTLNCQCSDRPQNRPNLILLAIGISKYNLKDIQLEYADRDAEELEKTFVKQRNGPLFGEVRTRVITNEKASRSEIIRALDWFSKEGTSNDLRILFLAGHGELDGAKNQYYFCSNQHTPGDPPEQSDVRWDTLLESLTRISGQAVLMIDTCHAGAVSGPRGTRGVKAVDITSVLKEFTEYPGVVVYAASTGTESSLEKSEWQHGAFTKALIEGLSGQAGLQNKTIGTKDLADWVITRVPKLTGNAQHSVMWSQPPDLLQFPIYALGGH